MAKKQGIEFRNVGSCELREADGAAPVLAGVAAPYYDGTEGTQYELWPGVAERYAPGCFDESIKQDDVRALFNHDPSNVLGRNRSGTLRLTSTSRGLEYEIDVDDTQIGRDVHKMAKRGDVDGSSCGWYAVKESWTRSGNHEIRTIEKAQLFDISPVTYPAYAASTVQARAIEGEGDLSAPRRSHEEWKAREQAASEAAARERDAAISAVQLAKIQGVDSPEMIS